MFMQKWKDENIDWRVQGRDFWLPVANMTHTGRAEFLAKNGLQFRDYAWCKKCNHPFWNCKCDDPKFKRRAKKLGKLRSAPFEDKLKHSLEIVEKVKKELANGKLKKVLLAYSGGFDSECCLQLFKQLIKEGKIQLAFADTLCDYPATYLRLKEVEQELGIKIIWARPPKGTTYETVTAQYGLPTGTRGTDIKTRTATEKCCWLLKKKPLHLLTEDYDGVILGLRLEENEYRKKSILYHGDYFFSTTHKQTRICPIAFWTTENEWKFQQQEKFKYSKIYDMTNCNEKGHFTVSDGKDLIIRSGCWKCPQSIPLGSDEWLERSYPRLFGYIMTNMPELSAYITTKRQARKLWTIINAKKKTLKKNKQQPCGEPL
jgi:3'-phosphoadenosine 5'-phosphosulfate sulfotransferase (PAPS reductase)/FAD synthetase